jgi:hypothetical protein
MTSDMRRRGRLLVLGGFAGAAWLAVVAAQVSGLLRYRSEAGAAGVAPATWPAAAPVELDPSRFTLLFFAHPHCPCTRASVAELERVMARSAGRFDAHAFFYADPALGEGWERSGLWSAAAAIPGVSVRADPLGEIAQRFGAMTSGQVSIYAPDGRLRFRGGITSARGHEGDGAGKSAVLALALGGEPEPCETAVYGCGLIGPADAAAEATP